jgi:DnaJ-domain-containing protein 1
MNSRKIPKTKILVEIVLDDGQSVHGTIFISPQGRMTDVLNDERHFLPVDRADGTFIALAKSAIRYVTPLVAEGTAYEGNNPYQILGVKEDVSREELKKTYHQLSMENHPDRLKGFGLGTDYLELATRRMARINEAYARIQKALGEDGPKAA